MPDPNDLSPATRKLARTVLDGISKARPHDPKRPRSIDDVVGLALSSLRATVERAYPEYFETKPARPAVKGGA